MSHRPLWALAAVAVGMVLLALLDPWQHSTSPPSPRIVGAETLSLVDQITVRQEGQVQQVQRQSGGAWNSVLPTPGAADNESVAEFLEALRLLRAVRRSAVRPVHGCTPKGPHLSLRSGPTAIRELTVCAASADGRHRWLLDPSRNTVSLVESHLVSELLTSAASFRSVQVVPWVLSPRVPVRVSLGESWLEVGSKTVRWGRNGSSPHQREIDPARRREWLRALAMLGNEAAPGCLHPDPLLVEQGERQVRLSSDSCVDAQDWLIVSTGLEQPERLADMHVLPTRRPEGNFRIQCKGSQRDVDIAEVDSTALRRWWEQLDGAAREIVPAHAFDTTCSLVGASWELALGQDEERWLAWVPGAKTLWVLDDEVATLLSGVSELFLSTLLIEQQAVFARRIEIRDASLDVALVRESGVDSWLADGGALAPNEATRLARQMSIALGPLLAERYAVGPTAKPKRHSTRRIRVDFEAELSGPGAHHELLLGGDAAGCWVEVDSKPRALLAPSDCAALWAR